MFAGVHPRRSAEVSAIRRHGRTPALRPEISVVGVRVGVPAPATASLPVWVRRPAWAVPPDVIFDRGIIFSHIQRNPDGSRCCDAAHALVERNVSPWLYL